MSTGQDCVPGRVRALTRWEVYRRELCILWNVQIARRVHLRVLFNAAGVQRLRFHLGQCQQCQLGKDSRGGTNDCYDVTHCWHGDTNTTEILSVGKYCANCTAGFKLQDGTCVADCVHGRFGWNGTKYVCKCHDEWDGSACNTCDDKHKIPGTLCTERKCNEATITYCFCGYRIVEMESTVMIQTLFQVATSHTYRSACVAVHMRMNIMNVRMIRSSKNAVMYLV